MRRKRLTVDIAGRSTIPPSFRLTRTLPPEDPDTTSESTAMVDVLILSFNTKDLLRNCLRSMSRHLPTDPSLRVVVSVLDNGSADGSADMVSDEFPSVRLVRSKENLGFGKAMNMLAATSTATYLMPLNSDTVWLEDILTPLVGYLEREPAVALVSPRLLSTDGSTQLSSQSLPNLRSDFARRTEGKRLGHIPMLWDAATVLRQARQEDLVDEVDPRDTELIWATCWLIRRTVIERFGFFDEAFPLYDEDVDFCLRLQRAGVRIVYYPGVAIEHIGGASNPSEGRHADLRRARLLYYRRNHSRGTYLAYLAGIHSVGAAKRLATRVRRRPAAG